MQIKSAKRFGLRALLPLLIVGILGFAAVLLLPPEKGWLWFSLLVVLTIAAALLSAWRLGRFYCPDCGAHLPQYLDTDGKPDAPIKFYCQPCDVLWETGLRTTSD